MTDVEAIVQRYYEDRPVLQHIEDAVLGEHSPLHTIRGGTYSPHRRS